MEIWVNTRRAPRALTAVFAAGPGAAAAADPGGHRARRRPARPVDLPPPVPALRRKLELARLVRGLAAAEPELAAGTAVFDLADSLAELLDEMQGEGVRPPPSPASMPASMPRTGSAACASSTLIDGYLAAAGPAEGQGRMRAAAEALAAAWAATPPTHPVIVAGSTGSRGATRAFMAAVARLPQGALVLPGFDAGLPPAVWERLGADDPGAADHPQHGFRRLADALGFDPAAVPAWHPDAAARAGAQRARLAGAAAGAGHRPVAARGRARSPAGLAAACAGLDWVEAPDPRAEALAIALGCARPPRRRARGARHPRPQAGAPGHRRARPLGPHPRRQRRPAAGADPARRAAPPPRRAARRAADAGGAARPPQAPAGQQRPRRPRRPPAPDRPPGARASCAAARPGSTGRSSRLGRGRRRRCAGLDRLAATPRSRRSQPGAPLPLAEHVARHRAAAEALAAGPTAAAAHGLWEQEAGQQALRAPRRARRRGGRRRAPSRPTSTARSSSR